MRDIFLYSLQRSFRLILSLFVMALLLTGRGDTVSSAQAKASKKKRSKVCIRYAKKRRCWRRCLRKRRGRCIRRSRRRTCARRCLRWKKATPPPSAKKVNTNTAPAKDSTLGKAILGIQRYYGNITTFCASFKQIFTRAQFARPQKETGRFFFRRPGMLRFQYESPERKDFIVNGALQTLWMYYPEDEEVKIRKNVRPADFGVAMNFLWGSGSLLRTFKVRLLSTKKIGRTKYLRLELIPRSPQSLFKKLYFLVHPTKYFIRETTYTDPAGNRNRFIFKRTVSNKRCPLNKSLFRFTPPPGTEVMYLR